MKKPPVVISLGGSLIAPHFASCKPCLGGTMRVASKGAVEHHCGPKWGVDAAFLRRFKGIVTTRAAKGARFVIICGGGATARSYQKAARAVGQLSREDVDWIGIHSTRLNGHLLRSVFKRWAHPSVVKNPNAPPSFREPVLIAAGWKPGWSTDFCAVLLASALGATTVVNLSDVDHVYSADPRKVREAKPFKRIAWKEFRKLVGNRWDPGANVPFDPVASKLAERLKLTVKMVRGRSYAEVGKALDGRPFTGTIIG